MRWVQGRVVGATIGCVTGLASAVLVIAACERTAGLISGPGLDPFFAWGAIITCALAVVLVAYWIAGGDKATGWSKRGLPLSPEAEREARAWFIIHRSEQDTDAIRKPQQEMMDRPAEDSGRTED